MKKVRVPNYRVFEAKKQRRIEKANLPPARKLETVTKLRDTARSLRSAELIEKGQIEFHRPPRLVNELRAYRAGRDAERLGQIQNFEHLLETLESGDIETAKDWIKMAIKQLSGTS